MHKAERCGWVRKAKWSSSLAEWSGLVGRSGGLAGRSGGLVEWERQQSFVERQSFWVHKAKWSSGLAERSGCLAERERLLGGAGEAAELCGAAELLGVPLTLLSLDSDASAQPGFTKTWEVLCTLGKVFMNILLPYVCIELSLSEQLTLLSTTTHMLLAMAHKDNAGTKLMPSQLYIDLMIMVKNAYFCIAKAKVDNLIGKFFLILLGMDRLEDIFGIL